MPANGTETDIYEEMIDRAKRKAKSVFYHESMSLATKERESNNDQRARSLTNPRFIDLLHSIQGLPFWIPDREEHKQAIDECKELNSEQLLCCFNHAIGLPYKDTTPLPIFDYEMLVVDALEQHKRVWVKKARGLGITEIMLRYIVWLCMRDNRMAGSMICIVTGPRQSTANEHITRIERLFDKFGIYFDSKLGHTEINDVTISSFPSHHVASMRGYDKVPLIFLDEADFFPIGQQYECRAVAEGYIPKTNPRIVMVSTPDRPDGLFATMEKEENSGYTKLFLDYTYGVGKIYDAGVIEAERNKEYFEREYNLKYLGRAGNVFHPHDITMSTALEQEALEIMDWSASTMVGRSMGIDPGWGTESEFGIAITQKRNNRIEVFHCESLPKPRFNDAIDRVMQLKQQHHITKLYIDGSAANVVRELKARVGEFVDYHRYTEEQLWNMRTGDMQIIPVNFSRRHIEMLNWAAELMQDGGRTIRIHPKLTDLIVSLRTAVATEGRLDKEQTSHHDCLDAFRLSLLNYSRYR
jgi:hypothetical protein